MCDVAERLKNMGRQEERINAVKFAISLGASEEKILKQYSKEEYEKALALMKAWFADCGKQNSFFKSSAIDAETVGLHDQLNRH